MEITGDGITASTEQIEKEQDADNIVKICDKQFAVVSDIERKRKEIAAPKLYDLTTLQREANRYSFSDALLIHAQRPTATACAELEIWNEKMHRWVNRGAKGIALLDDTSPRPRLRYVFDISDTHLVRGGRTPLPWKIEQEQHGQAILDHLTDTYGLQHTEDLNTALMELAQQLTEDTRHLCVENLRHGQSGHCG